MSEQAGRSRLCVVGVAVGLLLGASPQQILLAQSHSCRPASELAENLIGYVRSLASATDSATAVRRVLWHIPAMPPDSIVFVDRESVCLRAARVYEQYVPDHKRHVARRVWVIKAGNVFIVSDPTVHIGEWGLTLVLDSRFRYLRSFL